MEYCRKEEIRYLTLTFIALRNLATIDESKMKVPVLKRKIEYGIHCVNGPSNAGRAVNDDSAFLEWITVLMNGYRLINLFCFHCLEDGDGDSSLSHTRSTIRPFTRLSIDSPLQHSDLQYTWMILIVMGLGVSSGRTSIIMQMYPEALAPSSS